MPVILIQPAEVEQWLTASAEEVVKLQRPMPNYTLRIVARGLKKDGLDQPVATENPGL